MPVDVKQSTTEVCFEVSGEVCRRLLAWRSMVNERISANWKTTQSSFGRPFTHSERGSGFTYEFRVDADGVQLTAKNNWTNETIELVNTEISLNSSSGEENCRVTFSISNGSYERLREWTELHNREILTPGSVYLFIPTPVADQILVGTEGASRLTDLTDYSNL